jgi:hypothetical protein
VISTSQRPAVPTVRDDDIPDDPDKPFFSSLEETSDDVGLPAYDMRDDESDLRRVKLPV